MESSDVSILEYSPTLRTTQKSESCGSLPSWELILSVRILIACIHNLGTCLCPRCLIPKDRVQNLATERDFLQRKVLAHTDTTERQAKVVEACKLIYDKNYVVDMAHKSAVLLMHVEALLKSESLVPTSVSSSICFVLTALSIVSERILQKTQSHRFRFFQYACGASVNPLFSHSPDSHYSIVTASYSMTARQCHRLTTGSSSTVHYSRY